MSHVERCPLSWDNGVAARLTRGQRRRWLHLPASWAWAQAFVEVIAATRAIPLPPPATRLNSTNPSQPPGGNQGSHAPPARQQAHQATQPPSPSRVDDKRPWGIDPDQTREVSGSTTPKEPMTLFELQAWLGHRSPQSTQFYTKGSHVYYIVVTLL